MEWTTACVDWESRLVEGRSIIPAPIYRDEAEAALAIFRELKVVDLPGKPTFGECSEQWVFDFVAAIFGAYDAETGQQLIREYGLLISKKNTKSTIAAGIMLTALILCWREDEEHLILAPTKEVADNSFKPAAGMIRADEELSALFHVQGHVRTITHRLNGNSLKVVAADTDTVSGKKSGKVLVDELWLFGKRGNAEGMFLEALGGQVSRDEGWVIFLTTQSDEPPAGVFKEKLGYWRDIRDGVIVNPKVLGVLYEFPAKMVERKEYLARENFYITNPNIGKSVSAEWLADKLLENQTKTDGTYQQFLAKHLNVEIGLNLRSDRWLGADFWEAAAIPVFTLEELLERCEVATIGIDGGGLDDMLGLAVVGREIGTGRWLVWTRAWLHPIALERRKSEESRYRDFAKQGDLVLAEQVGKDIADVIAIVSQVVESGLLDKAGVDRAGLGGIYDALVGTKDEPGPVKEDQVVGIPQGWQLQGAIKTAERHLAAKKLVHGGRALMAWCVGNAKVVAVGNAISITKQASGFAKIDPLMALFDAIYLMALNPKARGRSVYEERGFRYL
ncbi:terminase large subunit [Acidovorax sp. NCPPB 3576]|uniref:terminase large subunit n=1 Tax=Acidovorax sp. NCPPB 3576 TaxID=2940488 RepID=UPI00234905BC|nr:terminase large subunit [Acidovorax sp. NCPPB 3576]WCM88838.1 terminase large subunit [Acidovorax sp. NCPPB 3576]